MRHDWFLAFSAQLKAQQLSAQLEAAHTTLEVGEKPVIYCNLQSWSVKYVEWRMTVKRKMENADKFSAGLSVVRQVGEVKLKSGTTS